MIFAVFSFLTISELTNIYISSFCINNFNIHKANILVASCLGIVLNSCGNKDVDKKNENKSTLIISDQNSDSRSDKYFV